MSTPQRSSAVDEASGRLLVFLRGGRWTDHLPGVRVLSRLVGTSPQTMHKAMLRLADQGWILHEGGRKRMRVNHVQMMEERRETRRGRRLLFLTPDDAANASHSVIRFYSELIAELSPDGWDVRVRMTPYSHSEAAQARWDRILEDESPDVVVAWTGMPALANWAVTRKVRMIFLGGVLDELRVPIIGTAVIPMVERAVGELIRLGHRKITLPCFGRSPKFRRKLQVTMKEQFDRHGLPFFENQQVPATDQVRPTAIFDLISRQWDSIRPTAIILLDWGEYVPVSCFLRKRQLDLPGDLSVVLLSHDPSAELHIPPLAHFRYPVKRIIKQLAEWVRNPLPRPVRKMYQSHWVAGGSVAPPPKA